MVEAVEPRWRSCVVAAPGPSLEPFESPLPVIVVQNAYQKVAADVLYGCDARWWDHYKPDFAGEKWSSHNVDSAADDKRECAERHGLRLMAGRHGDGFSLDPEYIHYGDNSGFQAVNLALLFGCTRVILTGFDMKPKGGRVHFFGDHPAGFGSPSFERLIQKFQTAAKLLPPEIEIINATPDSALTCFPTMELSDALLFDHVSPSVAVSA